MSSSPGSSSLTSRLAAAVVSAAALLSLTACGGDDPSPAASALPSPGSTAGAGDFQSALDRLVIDRAVARTDRAEAAADFNSPDSDRAAAMDAVRTACADLERIYRDFGDAVQQIEFDETAETDVDAVISATENLAEVLAKYADATATERFAAIDQEERIATEVWEATIRALAMQLGTAGLPGATPAPSASPSGSSSASPVPSDPPTQAPSESPSPSGSATP